MSGIELHGITKRFGTTEVLRGIDLAVRAGEFLTLVGPSGCGKSTLLRIVAGLEAPTTGSVEVGGRGVTGVRAAERNLAMVFQSYALYPHLTARQNMLTPLRLRDLNAWERLPLAGPLMSRTKRRALGARVAEVAEVLQITPLLDRKPGELSGGQRQRVALGRAMVRQPAAFLMDEPLSNLDAALRVHMRTELAELHRSLGATFVYVTHDQAEALTMSDRLAVMMDGRILQLATPREVYDGPADLAVARFIGSPQINTLPGDADGTGRLSVMGRPLGRRAATRPGAVTVAFRPEAFGPAAPRGAMLAGRVRTLEHLGSDVFVHVALADGAHRVVLRATPAECDALAVGDEVGIDRRAGEALIFDAEGRRAPLAAREADAVPAQAVA
ncbi:ABC transporter ATP-binding protein [Acuticoccus sp.]|uniref:ABC transporter ATP-binding protein n=1 Tax=Acuticoccus sp. TaxID=1904378 RepID=UPI003B51724D